MSDLFPRSSGILLHPTSLPGEYGIGDLGEWAYTFVDWLVEHQQTIWQVLPLGPTSYGDSPYQTLSAFAGNPNLISVDKLAAMELLTEKELADNRHFPHEYVDFGPVIGAHDGLLHLAYERFKSDTGDAYRAEFEAWCKEHASWLEDFCLFAALKDAFDGKPWVEWPRSFSLRDEAALANAADNHADRINEHRFRQWLFDRQWMTLKAYANEKGVRIFGDLPIFVAHDSADVWANSDLFYLDERGNPEVIAGVPPDYFSPTGQRWGNPLYKWDAMQERDYSWWISRFEAILRQCDYIRIDHFRGFDAYWEIPGQEETAVNGEWVPGPGHAFFKAVKDALGDLPMIAEDLGVITEGVEQLREDFNLPGMKVLQFAWSSGPKNPFLPHNHKVNCVVYSGTHDNNTTLGWWNNETDDDAHQFISEYLNEAVNDPNWMLMRVGMASVAHTFIMPMQDVLGLDKSARMNTPGQPSGNWTWRFTEDDMEKANGDGLARLTWLFKRRPDQQESIYGDTSMMGKE